MDQSEPEANACNRRQARENACERGTIDFGFASHWLRKWHGFVYVIGLHAVQFGNNWMRKIPRTAKLDEAVGRVQFGSPRNFLNPIISKFDKHVVLLPINYRASENVFVFLFFVFFVQSLFKAKLNVRAKTIQFILNWTVCIN